MMFDFRLKVFYTVAQRLSFTKAAEELFISQPAVTKHIHELETQFGQTLVQRTGGKIALTKPGYILLEYCKKIFSLYHSLEFDLAQLKGNTEGILRIGASTTIAQYILPKILGSFLKKHKQIKVSLINANTDAIEELLKDEKIDIGMIEGPSGKSFIHYKPFLKDEIVLVTNTKNKLAGKDVIDIADIKKLPLVIREHGSGTLSIVQDALQSNGIKENDLRVVLRMGSTEGIKQFLLCSDAFAFISVHSIINELASGQLKTINIANVPITRTFQFIHLHGHPMPLAEVFMRYCLLFNKQK